MEQKIKIGIRSLYGVVVITALSAVLNAIKYVSLFRKYPELERPEWLSLSNAICAYDIVVILMGLYFAKMLEKQNPWGWVGALSVFFLALPSFALPASVIGMVVLLDKRVRDAYFEKLDIEI